MLQHHHGQPGRQAPGYNEQCAQLTAARAEHDWLAAGSQTVQQQALHLNSVLLLPKWSEVGILRLNPAEDVKDPLALTRGGAAGDRTARRI